MRREQSAGTTQLVAAGMPGFPSDGADCFKNRALCLSDFVWHNPEL